MTTKILEKNLRNELHKAEIKFTDFHDPHQGYAIIKEELDELWDEIKTSQRLNEMYTESLHVAVTAIRFAKMIERKMDSDIIKKDKI